MNSITHPSHPDHPLILTYPSGKVICDACFIEITRCKFYRCSTCDFDIHIECAMKPLVKIHNLHRHPLVLTFAPRFRTISFTCADCHHAGTSHWLYRCKACEFNIHPDCPATQSEHISQAPAPAAAANQCVVKGFVMDLLKGVIEKFIEHIIFDD